MVRRTFVARVLRSLAIVHHTERTILLLHHIPLLLLALTLHSHDALPRQVLGRVVSLRHLVERAAGLALRKRRLLVRKPLLVLLVMLRLVLFQNLLYNSGVLLLAKVVHLVLLVGRLVGDVAGVVVGLLEGGAAARTTDRVGDTAGHPSTSLGLCNVAVVSGEGLGCHTRSLQVVIQILPTFVNV